MLVASALSPPIFLSWIRPWLQPVDPRLELVVLVAHAAAVVDQVLLRAAHVGVALELEVALGPARFGAIGAVEPLPEHHQVGHAGDGVQLGQLVEQPGEAEPELARVGGHPQPQRVRVAVRDAPDHEQREGDQTHEYEHPASTFIRINY